MLDVNSSIGQPDDLAMFFDRKATRRYDEKVPNHHRDLGDPAVRTHCKNGFIKQDVATTVV